MNKISYQEVIEFCAIQFMKNMEIAIQTDYNYAALRNSNQEAYHYLPINPVEYFSEWTTWENFKEDIKTYIENYNDEYTSFYKNNY